MKILVLEYITGGGFSREPLPPSLAREGLLMLTALLEGLCALPEHSVTVMLDARLAAAALPENVERVLVGADDDCNECFRALLDSCDAAWPVAPEFSDILFNLCAAVEAAGKLLLNSGSEAVRLAGDKYATFQCLQQAGIASVPTALLADCAAFPGECIIKPRDGVGCDDSVVIAEACAFKGALACRDPQRAIVQPHLDGDKISLSCLFAHGRGWLLSVNRQHFDFNGQSYRLVGIEVNRKAPDEIFQTLTARIAAAMPGLWGYAGIDLIETADALLVLEVNPRLTSSFAGLGRALGVNAADFVLALLRGELSPLPRRQQTITLRITENA